LFNRFPTSRSLPPFPTRRSSDLAKPNAPAKSPEYRAYEKRYAELGEERPKLTQKEFEEYEDELLDLLALNDKAMTDDQIVRIQEDRKSTRLNSSHQIISYAVFCL